MASLWQAVKKWQFYFRSRIYFGGYCRYIISFFNVDALMPTYPDPLIIANYIQNNKVNKMEDLYFIRICVVKNARFT